MQHINVVNEIANRIASEFELHPNELPLVKLLTSYSLPVFSTVEKCTEFVTAVVITSAIPEATLWEHIHDIFAYRFSIVSNVHSEIMYMSLRKRVTYQEIRACKDYLRSEHVPMLHILIDKLQSEYAVRKLTHTVVGGDHHFAEI